MHIRPFVAGLAALVVACSSEPASNVTPPPQFTSGSWTTPFLPSGAYTVLALQFAADSVHGTILEYGLMTALVDSGTIRGTYSGTSITFQIHFASGAAASYAGSLTATDRITGMWTTSTSSGQSSGSSIPLTKAAD